MNGGGALMGILFPHLNDADLTDYILATPEELDEAFREDDFTLTERGRRVPLRGTRQQEE